LKALALPIVPAKLVAIILAIALMATMLAVLTPMPAQASGAGDCVMSNSYLGSYLTCDGTKKKVFTTIGPDRQISWGFTDRDGHYVNVYTATQTNIYGRHEGVYMVCSMSWGGLCKPA
jgi:hypothetical protein